MRPRAQKTERGTALIITVGLLAVLAVIGFGFAVLARLHHDISGSYRASAQSDLIAQAAMQYAVGEIRYGWAHAPAGAAADYRTYQTGAVADPSDSPADPWFVDPTISSTGYVDTGGKKHYCNLRCNSYALVHDDLGARLGVSNIKVFDCAGKLNINDRDGAVPASLPDPSTHAATARLYATLHTLLVKLGYTSAQATGIATKLLQERSKLPNQRFGTLDEVKTKVLDQLPVTSTPPYHPAREYEILKHYLTIYSWPHQPPSDLAPYTIDPQGTTLERKSSAAGAITYCRSPINLNTAGKELIYALLRGVVASDGTLINDTDAEEVALWLVRKRGPERLDHWPNATMTAAWKNWVETTNPTYDRMLERKIAGWSAYPVGPFNSWNEAIDFFYGLAPRTTAFPHQGASADSDPFPDTVLNDKKVEAILAAFSPNVYATGLAGYTRAHISYSRISRDSGDDTGTKTTFREQISRDADATTPDVAPQVTGKNQLSSSCYNHPVCFSSLGRQEVYSRTYTFLKCDQGLASGVTANTLTAANFDGSAKTWLSSPSQWRGYTVVIYEGKGKGQMRGIVYIKNDLGGNNGRTLVVDKWRDIGVPGLSDDFDTSTDPNNDPKCLRTRYYIVGPGAFSDRVPAAGKESSISTPLPHILTDTETDTAGNWIANWEDGQWNGHRIVLYKATLSGTVETIDDNSIQERTIIGTDRATKSLILAPDLDLSLFTASPGNYIAYMILGCDGVVEHSGAFKAYDVVHDTTQEDFETLGSGRAAAASSSTFTYAATGPNHARDANGSLVAGIQPSRVDGWIAARRKEPTAPANALRLNFTKPTLAPEEGGAYVASNPTQSEIIKDVFTQNGMLLSDGLRLTGGSGRYVEYSVSTPLISNNRTDGGYVSLWIRPEEGFFSGTRNIIKIQGEDGQEELALQVVTTATNPLAAKLQLKLTFTKARDYEGTITDGNHLPMLPTAPPVQYQTDTGYYEDASYSNISTWRIGEWHHIAFAWYECSNDDPGVGPPGGNTDGNLGTDWRDDDTSGVGGKPDYKLDPEVASIVRLWVDTKSSAVAAENSLKAFNFYPPANSAVLRLCGDANATVDSVIVRTHADKQLNFTISPEGRYDGFNVGAPDNTQYAEYQSRSISIPNTGGDAITLGTISWTGFLPWMKEEDRWGGPISRTNKFPIRGQAALGGTWSLEVPQNAPAATAEQPGVFGGGRLRKASDERIIANTATSLQYRIYLLPRQGTVDGDNKPGLLEGRQTPVVEDVTITYLGPVVFYFWQ
ncbi:MAG TPA: hypothetical protein P5532_10500 [Planctomycetota bacterium]|nr:hypothetical protein [Planctomycetota bacterium]HRT94840.1 hypothetical protein [Planctomycetota bacterium]